MLWAYGSWAQGAADCGDLDLALDLRYEWVGGHGWLPGGVKALGLPGFDTARVVDHARRVYFVVQQAVGMRELAGVREYLTPEMAAVLQAQCDRLRSARRTNRVEQLDLRRVEVTEAWQEGGQDYVTVLVAASMIDYTVDDGTGAVVEGSRTTPQAIEDFWTFARAVGDHPWRLSAIQA